MRNDIRGHSAAILLRHDLSNRLNGRRDIFEHGAALVDHLVHGRGSILPSAPVDPLLAAMVDRLVAHDEFEPAESDIAAGLPLPGGMRYSFLHFSPWLQFAKLASPDGLVMGRNIHALPVDRPSLRAWFERTTGLAEDIAEVAASTRELIRLPANVRDAMRKMFMFDLDELCDWLLGIRDTDPVLYVLLLSREFELALAREPALDRVDKKAGFPRVNDKWNKAVIIPSLMIAEAQRAASLIRDLALLGETPPTTETAEHIRQRAHAIAATMDRRASRYLFDSQLQVAGMRHLLYRQRQVHRLHSASVHRKLRNGQLDWDDRTAVLDRYSGAFMRTAALAADVFKRVWFGPAHRMAPRPLDCYYGVPLTVLPFLIFREICGSIGRGGNRNELPVLACAMLKTIAPDTFWSMNGSVRKRIAKGRDKTFEGAVTMAIDFEKRYLPRFGLHGSAGRFRPEYWLKRDHDRRLFAWIASPPRPDHPRVAKLALLGAILEGIWWVRAKYPRLFASLLSQPRAVRALCDIATGSTVLTKDPVFHAMLKGLGRWKIVRLLQGPAIALTHRADQGHPKIKNAQAPAHEKSDVRQEPAQDDCRDDGASG